MGDISYTPTTSYSRLPDSLGQSQTRAKLAEWSTSHLTTDVRCAVVTGISGTGKSDLLKTEQQSNERDQRPIHYFDEEFIPKIAPKGSHVIPLPLGRKLPPTFCKAMTTIPHKGFSCEELRARITKPKHLTDQDMEFLCRRVSQFALGSIRVAFSLCKEQKASLAPTPSFNKLVDSVISRFLMEQVIPFLPKEEEDRAKIIGIHAPDGVDSSKFLAAVSIVEKHQKKCDLDDVVEEMQYLHPKTRESLEKLISGYRYEPRIVITTTQSVSPTTWFQICGEINDSVGILIREQIITERIPSKTGLAYLMHGTSAHESGIRWWKYGKGSDIDYMLSAKAIHAYNQRLAVVDQFGLQKGQLQFFAHEHITTPTVITLMALVEAALQRHSISYQKLSPHDDPHAVSTLLEPHAVFQYESNNRHYYLKQSL